MTLYKIEEPIFLRQTCFLYAVLVAEVSLQSSILHFIALMLIFVCLESTKCNRCLLHWAFSLSLFYIL